VLNRAAIICFLLLSLTTLKLQSQDQVDHQLWLDYYHYYQFKPDWTSYGDAGYRTVTDELSWMEIYIRPSISWHKKKLFDLNGGLGFFYTFNYDTVNNFEFRPWQGIKFKWPNLKHISFYGYVRIEERFNFPVDTWALEFNLRFRFKVGFKAMLYTFDHEMPRYIYLPFSVEVFANAGPNLTEEFSDRARISSGLGYRANHEWAFELDFTLQGSRTGQDQQYNSSDLIFQFKLRRFMSNRMFKRKQFDDYAD
jgi:hypothetical protein